MPASGVLALLAALAAFLAGCSAVPQSGQSDTTATALPAPPTPRVSGIAPATGPQIGGTLVTITGANLQGATEVDFGQLRVTLLTISPDGTQITCTTPASAANGGVTVAVLVVGSPLLVLSTPFVYQPKPTFISVQPSSGPVGGQTPVTVTGSFFLGNVSASLGGIPLSQIAVDSTHTHFTALTGQAAAPGVVGLSILSSTNGGVSVQNAFTYFQPTRITQVTPTQGVLAGGTHLTILGDAFLGNVSVTVGGATLVSPVVNAGQGTIAGSTPASMSTGAKDVVVVSSTNGSATATGAFTYVANPVLSSIQPASGPLSGGMSVTITGTGFDGSALVQIGGKNLTGVQVDQSLTVITGLTPRATTPGPATVSVTLTASGAAATTSVTYTYNALPSIGSLSPTSGPIAGGTPLTISGTNFLGNLGVTVGGVQATGITTITPGTLVSCVVPRGTTVGKSDVVLTASLAGTGRKAGGYTYNAPPAVTQVFVPPCGGPTCPPAQGPLAGGTPLTITGSNLGVTGSVTVTLGTTLATGVVVSSNQRQITCTAPAVLLSGTVDLGVFSDTTGNVTAPAAYTYLPLPSIASVTPTNGPRSGGTALTIKGSGFLGSVNVTVGFVAATNVASSVDGTSIACTTSATGTSSTASLGDVIVQASRTGSAIATGKFTYNASINPATTSISPVTGIQSGGTPFSISGANFGGQVSILVGPAAATGVTTNVSQTLILAVLPASATTGTTDVTILSSTNGSVVLTRAFTYTPDPSAALACPLTTPAGSSPQSVVVTDLNGDGIPDLAVADAGVDALVIQMGVSGPTSVTYSVPFSFSTGAFPAHLAVADINRDGLPDIVVSNADASTVSVFLNTTPSLNPTPTFAPRVDLATLTGPAGLAILDLNADATPDIAVACATANRVSVFLNTTAAGAFPATFDARVDVTAGAGCTAIATGDLDGDGLPDLLVVNRGDDSVWALRNQTPQGSAVPAFAAPVVVSTGHLPVAACIADLDGDGKPDIVVADQGASAIEVRSNFTPGAGQTVAFGAPLILAAGAAPSDVAAVDLSGDGKDDLIVAARDGQQLTVWLNTSVASPNFSPGFGLGFDLWEIFPTAGSPVAMRIADLNADGAPDVALAEPDSRQVEVRLDLPPGRPSSASFSPSSVSVVGLTSTSSSIVVADVNGDGSPDLVAVDGQGFLAVSLNQSAVGTGTPVFGPVFTTTLVPASPSDVLTDCAVVDVNADGRPDVLAADPPANAVLVAVSATPTGSVTPSFPTTLEFAAGTNPSSMAVGDIDGDGRPDVVVTNRVPGPGTISVLINATTANSTPTFLPPVSRGAGSAPAKVALADIDGDGKLDAVVTNSAQLLGIHAVSVLLNRTAGPGATPSFSSVTSLALTTAPFGLVVADLDGDGRPDIATANAPDSANVTATVSIFLNRTPRGAAAPVFSPRVDVVIPAPSVLNDLSHLVLINGDGDCRKDLAVPITRIAGLDLVILSNRMTKGASLPVFATSTVSLPAPSCIQIGIGDLNGDGRDDLVIASPGANVVLNTSEP